MPTIVLRNLPNGSTAYQYGALDRTGTGFAIQLPEELKAKEHKISFFAMPSWVPTLQPEEARKWIEEIIKDLLTGGAVFSTTVGKVFKLGEFEEAIDFS